MEYNINLGSWKSVFAVPSDIVDKHLRLAGAAQLKVLLWFLRHAGEPVNTEVISDSLLMHEADVRDCMQYWVQTGVIAVSDNIVVPSAEAEVSSVSEPSLDETSVNIEAEASSAEPVSAEKPIAALPKETKTRALSRPEKPDNKYLSSRIKEDESIAFMMQTADELYGRMTSNNDKATLLMIHEHDGLPVEVIIMLMQYAFSTGRGNMRYIEKMAINWADEEINTLEAAEKKIKLLTEGATAAKRVQRIIGADDHSPTDKETTFANRWINEWQFSDEMIRAAYEACVDSKGRYFAGYTNSILESWHKRGYSSPDQIEKSSSPASKKKKKDAYEPTYDISEYESTSVTDEEW